LYFSVPTNVARHFDLDYWGASYRQALEYIVTHDASPRITIVAANSPGWNNAMILPTAQRKRLRFVDVPAMTDVASTTRPVWVDPRGIAHGRRDFVAVNYFITNFRNNYGVKYAYEECYSIWVDGLKIMAVYRTAAGAGPTIGGAGPG
jgi:hypothetical protein